MKILITGANGFLGYYLVQPLLAEGYTVIATGKGENRLPFQDEKLVYAAMDFTDPYSVHDVFTLFQPDVVIHAGAMSKPDECEKNQWQAYITNVEGTVTLLTNAEEFRSFFLFVSTDFIFNGEKGSYREEDPADPVNFYGKTKWEAEDAVREYPFEWAIVRTVLVYGKPQTGRSNLLTIVKEKLEKGEEYGVFDDQVRTPTYVEDLAWGIVAIIRKNARGVFHLSGDEVLTPYQMACRMADGLGLDSGRIRRIAEKDLAQPARRPAKTGFDISRAIEVLGFQPLSFEMGLRKMFDDQHKVKQP